MRRSMVVLAFGWLVGCAEWSLFAEGDRSVGSPNSGWLERGATIGERGEGYVRSRPGDATRFGHARLVAAIEAASANVARAYPGGAPLRVGDLAGDGGGEHERHASHRTGRDADLAFYVTDMSGRSISGASAAFDRHGISRDSSGTLVRFDVARNWELVRTFLADDRAAVQWIFCSNGVKALLLRHARRVESDPDVLVRAAAVLHQPSNGRSHDDHFHVRITCDARDRALGCRDYGPRWPWTRRAIDAPDVASVADDRAVLDYLGPASSDDDAGATTTND